MKKSIAYDEKELKDMLLFIVDHINEMSNEIRLMEEQGLGFRENLDWKSSGKHLRINLESIKRKLDQFDIVEIESKDLNEYNYEDRFLRNVEEKCLEYIAKKHQVGD
jgi:CCR4-NOT transcriptional regulation complex NOT5 subunit